MTGRTFVTAFILLVLGAGTVRADIDRHARIKVTPILRNGKPGFQLNLTLMPTGQFPRASVGLGKHTTQKLDPSAGVLRLLAAGALPGYLLARVPEVSDLEANKPREVEHVFIYGQGDGKGLAPGMKVEVVSTFTGSGREMIVNRRDYPFYHVFGMVNGPMNTSDTSSIIELPGQNTRAKGGK